MPEHRPLSGPRRTRGQARPAPANAQPSESRKPPAAPSQTHPSAAHLKASKDRLLLESKEMDLFETGKTSRVYVCPECSHELMKIVCLGESARVCENCRGLWLSYSEQRNLSHHFEWFQQLGAALQLAIKKKSSPE